MAVPRFTPPRGVLDSYEKTIPSKLYAQRSLTRESVSHVCNKLYSMVDLIAVMYVLLRSYRCYQDIQGASKLLSHSLIMKGKFCIGIGTIAIETLLYKTMLKILITCAFCDIGDIAHCAVDTGKKITRAMVPW